MKAKVKATGKIVSLRPEVCYKENGGPILTDLLGYRYEMDELEFDVSSHANDCIYCSNGRCLNPNTDYLPCRSPHGCTFYSSVEPEDTFTNDVRFSLDDYVIPLASVRQALKSLDEDVAQRIFIELLSKARAENRH